ncbi:hypothetical protein AAMO2058_001083200 [Amorphochlora amoebiformis]
MGASISGLFARMFANRQARILMLGLDAAGKTTVLYKVKLGETITTIPTIGFNVEKLEHKGLDLTVWDIGGQDKLRPLWRHYFQNTEALVFVVDSADTERLKDATDELHKVMSSSFLDEACLLVMANKQDLPKALPPKTIAKKMQIDKIMGRRRWQVQGVVATTGQGVFEGFDWIAKTIKNQHNSK